MPYFIYPSLSKISNLFKNLNNHYYPLLNACHQVQLQKNEHISRKPQKC